MKKALLTSTLLASALLGESIKIDKILIEESSIKETKRVSTQEIKFTRQSDLAEILSETFPEITHVRSSGIGSDIILRGFERDNLNILIDGAKVHGACPNRMDPPAMHISSNQIKEIKVNEGPFDVVNFGGIGGLIEVNTKEPREEFGGEASFHIGSFEYNKASINVEGGDDKLKVLFGYSREQSNQYVDGDGNTLAEQIEKISANEINNYKDNDLDAYKRETIILKAVSNLSENQKLTLSYFRDSADDVLYPAFSMDAQIDNTDIFNIEYSYKDLKVKLYHSEVEHEMGTEFRKESNNPMLFRTHKIESKISGVKVENRFNLDMFNLTTGIDASLRNWNGRCLSESSRNFRQSRIPDVDTKNIALYSKVAKNIDNLNLNFGVRVDKTEIKANRNLVLNSANAESIKMMYQNIDSTKDYENVSANFMAKYNLDKANIFFGVGQSVRVPDAKEAFFIAGMPKDGQFMWRIKGNENLKEVINREVDLGVEYFIDDSSSLKTTLFYSDLTDFIYAYKNSMNTLTFANIDANIYGFDINYFRELSDEWLIDVSFAYQRGQKDTLIIGQKDKDLAGIPPLQARVAFTYERDNYSAMIEALGAGKQKDIDSDNGEQKIDGYATLNLKGGYEVTKDLSLNIGIDNIFDETYAVNNSYVGRGVIASTSEPMVLNEAGRVVYANLNFKF